MRNAIMQKNSVNCNVIYNHCQMQLCKQKLAIAIIHTKVVICNFCIQKLSQVWRNFPIFHLFLLKYRVCDYGGDRGSPSRAPHIEFFVPNLLKMISPPLFVMFTILSYWRVIEKKNKYHLKFLYNWIIHRALFVVENA